MIRKNIPNALTCANLLCGCIGVVEVFHNNVLLSCLLIGIALVFDFFDGFVARLLGVSSPIGRDLDSLADMVTFGLLPAVIVFQLLMQSIPDLFGIWKAYPAFMIAIFSAIRLAKFNNDPRQSDTFIGVPTPANAMLIASLPLILHFYGDEWKWLIVNTTNLWILTAVMSFLLVAEIPLLALKFKSFGWKGNEMRFSLILVSLTLLFLLKILAIPVIILFYILLSLLNNLIAKK
ncbi:CDP-diacylglycerol--serine O-phosphatidyltransferase [Dyadobacter luteus]|jgi:CDP-diacylglycerol--serine O-phosphatidyltransferase|uniref:CDP-diacylglycerol--serine O-phosphatidyltransferase n=1 Tax=Dyadobacter luteus TaxID=2259619 RepID=A0A3D8YCP0_9BACT|nr:CDP-diacylglycerol--serine O-phosphatidyltransferase [Dyadobacter luteus]REA61603.1 CDP-diacylglycerol--serine O-phosphatidyltransferase [Dyadobacter luteus]